MIALILSAICWAVRGASANAGTPEEFGNRAAAPANMLSRPNVLLEIFIVNSSQAL
jgi:hypothetical protein